MESPSSSGADRSSPKPPYSSYKSVTNTLQKFSDTAIPTHVDSSVLSNLSGSVRGQVRSALQFLGAIRSDGSKTERMDELVGAVGTPDWQTVIRHIITESYGEIVAGVDLKKGTAQQLAKAFSQTGISGSTLRRAVKFYLDALKDAGIEHSPHFRPPSRSRSTSTKSKKTESTKRPADKNNKGAGQASKDEPVVGDGMVRIDVPLPGKPEPVTLMIYTDMTPEEWHLVKTFFEAWFSLKQGTYKPTKNSEAPDVD